MTKILAHVAVHEGSVRRASLEVLSRARALARAAGGRVEAVLLGADPAAHVGAVRAYGPDRIYTVAHPALNHPDNELLLAALGAVVKKADPDVFVFASSEAVRDVLGALAERTAAAALSEVCSLSLVEGAVEARRPVMEARFLERLRAEGRPVLVSVRPGAYEAVEAPSGAEVERVAFDYDAASARPVVRETTGAGDGAVELSEARVVVAAGRGVRDDRGKKLVERLAVLMGAAIGASHGGVSNGLFPRGMLIGQGGRRVSPDLYVAVGISGAVQHVAGMAGSRVVVAINRDPDAAIFRRATYGLVGDLYEILPALIAELERP